MLLKQSFPSPLPSCAQVIANAPAAGLYCFVFWRAPTAPLVILVGLSGGICSSLWIPLASTGQSRSRQTHVHWRCQPVSQQRRSRRRRRRRSHTAGRQQREAVSQDGSCTLLHLSVLPLFMKTHNVISSLTLRAVLSLPNHRAAQTDTIQDWISFQVHLPLTVGRLGTCF